MALTMERASRVCWSSGSGSREMCTYSGTFTVPPSRSAITTSSWKQQHGRETRPGFPTPSPPPTSRWATESERGGKPAQEGRAWEWGAPPHRPRALSPPAVTRPYPLSPNASTGQYTSYTGIPPLPAGKGAAGGQPGRRGTQLCSAGAHRDLVASGCSAPYRPGCPGQRRGRPAARSLARCSLTRRQQESFLRFPSGSLGFDLIELLS